MPLASLLPPFMVCGIVGWSETLVFFRILITKSYTEEPETGYVDGWLSARMSRLSNLCKRICDDRCLPMLVFWREIDPFGGVLNLRIASEGLAQAHVFSQATQQPFQIDWHLHDQSLIPAEYFKALSCSINSKTNQNHSQNKREHEDQKCEHVVCGQSILEVCNIAVVYVVGRASVDFQLEWVQFEWDEAEAFIKEAAGSLFSWCECF
ncbi:hypothetical protein Tco_1173259 [Tanacetum coccineum]